MTPITVTAVSSLNGWHPGAPGNAVEYVSTDTINVYQPGPGGTYWTGDESEFAKLVPGNNGAFAVLTLAPITVPELPIQPLVVFGGLVVMFEFVRKKLLI